MRRRSKQRGFTLVELMITVAVIAILAAIAVPMFAGETRKSKSSSEIGAMFGELGIRQDQYKLENGAYLAAAACPATPTTQGTAAASCINPGGVWEDLRVRLSSEKLMCSYEITAGAGTGTNDPSGFTFTSPTGEWFYIIATCDMDGSATLNATYFVSSVSSTIQKQNEGN